MDARNCTVMWHDDSLVLQLASGAALLGFSAAACGLAGAEVRGLQAWVTDDSIKIGWLMCVVPIRGLPRVLLDLNTGLNCPEVVWKHLEKKKEIAHTVCNYHLDFVCKGKTDTHWKERLIIYLLGGRLFLMQCNKIPITRSISTIEPAASDTVNTNRPASETNKQTNKNTTQNDFGWRRE